MKKLLLFTVLIMVACSTLPAQNPGILISPASLSARLLPGSDTTVTTMVINQTADNISFSFPEFVIRNSGGPDVFGYQWIDSDEASFSYTWIDISDSGTEITGLSDDNRAGPFPIGFDFLYYGMLRNEFWVSSNGLIQFSDFMIPFANLPIPTNNQTSDFIAVFWDDLNFMNDSATAYYQQFPDKTVIQFENARRYVGSGIGTFQAVIYANGSIMLNYKSFSPEFALNSATVGIQSPDPALGLQVAYNQDYLHNNLSVLFSADSAQSDFITQVEPASGVLQPFSQTEITLTYSSAGYTPGRYQQTIQCEIQQGNASLPLYNLMIVSAAPKFFGHVSDAGNGQPIEGVQVSAGPYTTFTGPQGNYDLEVVPGTYTLTFEKAGFDSQTRPGQIIDYDQTMQISAALEVSDEFMTGGTAFAGIYPLDLGYVNAFKTSGGQVVDIFADLIDTLGYYFFPALPVGEYRIKAEPAFGSQYTGSYLPTYYGDVVHWADAQIINLTGNIFNADIHLVPATLGNVYGPGKISGHIYHAAGTKSGSGAVPAEAIPIFLRRGTDHAMAISDQEGYFEFTSLSEGTYTLFAELFGKDSEFRTIALNNANSISETNEMFIYESDILYGISENLPEGMEAVSQAYPNPSNEVSRISFKLSKPIVISCEILNSAGQSIAKEHFALRAGINDIDIPISGAGKGVYIIILRTSGGAVLTRRLIRY